jgi:hypothetical protein
MHNSLLLQRWQITIDLTRQHYSYVFAYAAADSIPAASIF